MQQFEVFHRRNRITFVGDRLASVSSRRPHSPRWAELDLYSTETEGVWVFSRVGRSVVYHMPSSPTCPRRLPYGHQVTGDLPPVSELMPCDVCNPSTPPSVDAPAVVTTSRGVGSVRPCPVDDFWTTHIFETSRPYAVVCDSAAMVDRQLRESDGSMGWLSQQLASTAAGRDPALSVIDPGPVESIARVGVRT